MTGLFMFISSSVNTIKDISRSSPYPQLELREVSGNCFAAGTLVLCEDGYKKIEDVQVGDKVLAYDEQTGRQDYKQVVQLFRNESKDWIGLTVDGEEIISTPGHKYYLPTKKKWLSAQDLNVGDEVLLITGETELIKQKRVIHYDKPETTYNFEVEDYHTYYVGNGVLVHNQNCTDSITVETYDDALRLAEQHLDGPHHTYKGNNVIWVSDSNPTKVVRFDIGNTPHVLREGPHLNLLTYEKPFGLRPNIKVENLHVFWRR